MLIENDIGELMQIMTRAFDEDAKRHLNEPSGGPPGYDTGEFLRKYALDSKSDAYKVFKDDQCIGAAIVWINPSNINFLGNMFIDLSLQDKGIGSIIWKYIEQKYPQTIRWKTETPGFSKRNHNFYVNKCGFKIIKIDNPKDKYEEIYILEKEM